MIMEKELSSKEQVKFISEMICQAKGNFAGESSFYFLLGGGWYLLQTLSTISQMYIGYTKHLILFGL